MASRLASTYRLQVHREFPLTRVRELVPYLADLGIEAVYLSPITEARPGSTHGYDVTDPTRLNPELGTDDDLRAVVDALHAHGMKLLVDIVPNHMAASPDNPWWLDVLESGQGSPFASYFDIDWHPAGMKGGLRGKLLVPILGAPYGEVLESGQLRLVIEPDGLFARYYETRLPLSPRSCAQVLRPALARLEAEWGADDERVRRLGEAIVAADALPHRSNPDEPPAAGWLRVRAAVKRGLLGLLNDNPALRAHVQATLDDLGGRAGDPASFDALDAALGAQHFWLSFWRLASQEINYRRFFNITDLVAVHVEDTAVMDATHAWLVSLARQGMVDGFRVDHIDGLRDPAQYLRRLQTRVGAPPVGQGRRRRPGFYVVVEKILARGEPLPADWACAGTTGYEFIAAMNELLIDTRGIAEMDAIYRAHTGLHDAFADVRYAQKKRVIERLFGGEVRSLADQLGRLAALDRHARDIPQAELTAALVEITACLPVYRTYVQSTQPSESDRGYLMEAFDEARRRAGEDVVSDGAMRFLRRVMLVEPIRGLEGARRARQQFLLRWQQFTGAAMAKGLEDSTFYIYNRLVSANEVGGDPDIDDAEDAVLRFHRFASDRQLRWPGALNATSTHDTKRSEDVRARINVLTEIPGAWAAALARWSAANAAHRHDMRGRPAPGPNQEVYLYQGLLGAWPFEDADLASFGERFTKYVIKSAREAAVRTSWMRPDEEHERALAEFVAAILDPARSAAFLDDFRAFHREIAYPGAINSLVQTLLKITAPGVPDLYQGTELWDFSLVDPDNRRPVDYERRRDALASDPVAVDELHASYQDGRIKLHVARAALRFRRGHRALFEDGDYLPLQVSGPRAAHVIAFARRHGREWAVVAAARFLHRLGGGAGRLPPGAWGSTLIVLPTGAPAAFTDILSGTGDIAPDEGRNSLDVERVFGILPLALLHGTAAR